MFFCVYQIFIHILPFAAKYVIKHQIEICTIHCSTEIVRKESKSHVRTVTNSNDDLLPGYLLGFLINGYWTVYSQFHT